MLKGEFNTIKDSKNNAKWKIYVKNNQLPNDIIRLIFYKENGEMIPMEIKNPQLLKDNEGYYFYGVFPSYDTYCRIDFYFENAKKEVAGAEYSEYKNKAVEKDIIVNEFTPNRINLRVLAENEGYLVALQAYYPGWRVYVNGEESEIVKINNTFRGVYLEKGEHIIEYIFIPLDFYLGAMITVVFYLSVVAIKIYKKH